MATDTTTIAGNLAGEITTRGGADTALSGRLDTVAVDTTTLKSQLNSVAVDTGTLYGKFTAVAVDTTTLGGQIAAKATDTLVTHLAGVETITGVKTFSADPVFTNDDAIPQAKVNGLTAALAAKAGTGANTFTGAQTLPGDPAAALQAVPKQYVDSWTRSCVNPADVNDIMVPVGGWCVDKYEASVWSSATGGTQYGVNGAGNDDYPGACTDIGSGCLNIVYARSVVTVKPSTYATWFQAAMACANAGKELLPNAVWQTAALGTPDPGADNSVCNVASYGTPMNTGALSSCVSNFGAFDMAGNVWEWVADWGAYAGTSGAWMNDYVWASVTTGVPAVVRGGAWGYGANAGVFAFSADTGPSYVYVSIGFRCGRRR